MNCFDLHFCAHVSGIQTECLGHIQSGRPTLCDLPLDRSLHVAALATVKLQTLAESGDKYAAGKATDLVVSKAALAAALKPSKVEAVAAHLKALVVRTNAGEQFRQESSAV